MFATAARVMRRDALFAFTAQSGPDDVGLGADLRYTHAADYLIALAKAAALEVLSTAPVSIRRDGGVPVPGTIVVLTRSGATLAA